MRQPSAHVRPPSAYIAIGESVHLFQELVASSRRAESSELPEGAVAPRGMSLPFTPLCLTFRELCYYVALPKVCTSSEIPWPAIAVVIVNVCSEVFVAVPKHGLALSKSHRWPPYLQTGW